MYDEADQAIVMSSGEGPVSTKANVEDLASSVELSGKRVFVRVSAFFLIVV